MSVNLKIDLIKFQYTAEVEQIYGLSRKIFILVSFFSKRISLTPTTLTTHYQYIYIFNSNRSIA